MTTDEDQEKRIRRRTFTSVFVAAGGAAVLALLWLVSGARPLEGQPVLWAGAILLMLTPFVWLGFFLILMPSFVAAFKQEREAFNGGGLALFALVPLGCLALAPVADMVARQSRDMMYQQGREFRGQQERASVKEVFRLGGDLRQFKGQSGATEDELQKIFGELDGSQLHLLTPVYLDQPRLMAAMAYYNTNPDDLRLIYERSKTSVLGGQLVLTNLAQNPHTPPDVSLAVGTATAH